MFGPQPVGISWILDPMELGVNCAVISVVSGCKADLEFKRKVAEGGVVPKNELDVGSVEFVFNGRLPFTSLDIETSTTGTLGDGSSSEFISCKIVEINSPLPARSILSVSFSPISK